MTTLCECHIQVMTATYDTYCCRAGGGMKERNGRALAESLIQRLSLDNALYCIAPAVFFPACLFEGRNSHHAGTMHLPETRVFAAQRGLDERLGRRLVEIDSSLQRVRMDTHASVVGLRDVAIIVERLEAKLDRIDQAVSRGDGAHSAPLQQEVSFDASGHSGVWNLSDGGYVRQNLPDDREDGYFKFEHRMADQLLAPRESLQDVNKKLEWIVQKLEQVVVTRVKGDEKTEDTKLVKGKPLHAVNLGHTDFGLLHVEPQQQLDMFQIVDKKLEWMSKMLDLVSGALGVKMGAVSGGDDAEDKKRLKEKLKDAVEKDRRDRFRKVESEQEVWMEYIFGICKPDMRTGKRGSRCYASIIVTPRSY
jgi:hypothetical protein